MLLQSAQNFGRLINLITGIQGVAPGGQASINMPVNQRIHRLNFQCSGIAWINPLVVFSGGTTGTTIVPPTAHCIVQAGVITNIVIDTGGSGYTGAPNVTVVDEVYGINLFNFIGTANLTLDAVSSVTITSGGTVAAVPPERFFTSLKHLVGGTIMRDIGADQVLGIAQFNNMIPQIASNRRTFGLIPQQPGVAISANLPITPLGSVGASQMPLPYVLGQLPVYFTENWRKIVNHDTATSWDLFGQTTYQILAGITQNITSPGLQGTYEFDYLRNAIPQKNAAGKVVGQQLFLKPVKQHAFSFNVPAGVYDLTTLPITYPIQRLYFYGPSLPYQIEVNADGNKVLEGTAEQVMQMYRDYGFNTDIFDLAYIADPDQHLGNALKVRQTLDVKIWNTNPAQLTVVMESTPPAYA
jgi:hypothetical protein